MNARAQRRIFTSRTMPSPGVSRLSALSFTTPIQLPEDVSASFEVATFWSRLMAYLLDWAFILVGGWTLIWLGVAALYYSFGMGSAVGATFIGVILIIGFFLITVMYFFVFEGLFGGATPGKRIIGIRTINDDGSPLLPAAGVARAFVRLPMHILSLISAIMIVMASGSLFSGEVGNVFEAIPGLMVMLGFVAVFDAGWLLLDPMNRRLGDLLAGTLVVDRRTPMNLTRSFNVPSYFELPDHYFPIHARELARLSPEDYGLMEEFGERIRRLHGTLRQRTAMTVAGSLATKMQFSGTVATRDAERFIYEVHCALREQLRQLHPDIYH